MDKMDIEPFEVTRFFDKYLRAILDLAGKYNITVIYSMPTTFGEAYEEERKIGSVEDYIDYLVHLSLEKHNLVVFYPQQDLKPKLFYENQDHLNFYGSLALSNDIGDKINELESHKK